MSRKDCLRRIFTLFAGRIVYLLTDLKYLFGEGTVLLSGSERHIPGG